MSRLRTRPKNRFTLLTNSSTPRLRDVIENGQSKNSTCKDIYSVGATATISYTKESLYVSCKIRSELNNKEKTIKFHKQTVSSCILNNNTEGITVLEIKCKHFFALTVASLADQNKQIVKLHNLLQKSCTSNNVELTKQSTSIISLLEKDFERQGRNINWTICTIQGRGVVFPNNIYQHDMELWAKYRDPVLSIRWGCWEKNCELYGSMIMRCGRSPINTLNEEDPTLLDLKMMDKWFAYINHPGMPKKRKLRKFFVTDCGSQFNMCQNLKYHADYFFANIEIAENYRKLFDLCTKDHYSYISVTEHDPRKWILLIREIERHMKGIGWLAFRPHLKRLWEQLKHGNIVIIQSSSVKDESDSVMVALLQLIVDPFYRTIEGFSKLIFKEFGPYASNISRVVDQPWIYLFSFIHCVFELYHQIENIFEFNCAFLEYLLDYIYSSTFFDNNDCDVTDTIFLDSISQNIHQFKSEQYLPRNYNFFERDPLESEAFPVMYKYILRDNETIKDITNKAQEDLDTLIERSNKQTAVINSLPGYWFDHFPNGVSNLTGITISKCALTYLPDELGSLSNLETLRLGGNNLVFISPAINQLTRLERLWLDKNKIAHISVLNLPNLKEIYLGENNLSDIEFIALCTKLTHISANQNRISHIPHELSNMRDLASINFSNNHITHFPSYLLIHLKDLTKITLSHNRLDYIPDFGELSNLETLDLSNNLIRCLPSSLFKPNSNLISLDLSGNKISYIPTTIGNLSNLSTLLLQKNVIKSLPTNLSKCNIFKLDLSGNQLKEVPVWYSTFNRLEKLNLNNNDITQITSAIGHLGKLRSFQFANNHLTMIPITMGNMTNLQKLNLTNNKLENVPQQYIQNLQGQSLKSLLQYLRTEASNKKDDGTRLKLVVLGQERVGKTSLIKCLRNKWTNKHSPRQQVQESDATMDGIEITSSTIVINNKKILKEEKKEKKDKKDKKDKKEKKDKKDKKEKKGLDMTVILDIWDFSGQTMNHAHQFFFSTWSIYILVYNITDAQAEAWVEFWIYSIKSHSQNAKVVLVGTHYDTTNQSIEKERSIGFCAKLAERHDKVTFLTPWIVSCNTGYNIDELRSYLTLQIYNYINENKELAQEFSSSYILFEELVKEYRAGLSVPVISQNELRRIGTLSSMNSNILLKAARHFHKLGLLLYYENIKELRDFVILDVKWLYGVLSTLFSTKQVVKKNGLLDYETLINMWKNYPAEIHENLLSLINKFQIGFPVTEQEKVSLLGVLSIEKKDAKNQLGVTMSSERKNKKIKAIFIPALLHTQSRPDDVVQSYFSFPVPVGHIYLFRSFQSSYLPNGLFARIVMTVLQSYSPKVITIWRQGILFEISEREKTAKVLVEHDFPDLEVQSANVFKDSKWSSSLERMKEVTLEVQCNEAQLGYDVFVSMIERIITISSEWRFFQLSMNWSNRSIVTIPTDIHVSDLEDMFQKGTTPNGLKDYKHEFAIPETSLPDFTGLRVQYKDIEIAKEIGSGSFARVFIGKINSKQVAVKELLESEIIHLTKLKCRHEVILQNRLKHPSIVEILGVCHNPMCILFELCTKGDLHAFIHDLTQNITCKMKVKVMLDVARGLQYLHNQSIVHCDIKSPNILLISMDPDSPICAKIADFGTAVKFSHSLSTRQVDNPVWLAPEIIDGKEYDMTIDTYAFGVIAWELYVRMNFFAELTTFHSDIEDRVRQGERPKIPVECPKLYQEVIQSCWSQLPLLRPPWDWVVNHLVEITNNVDEYEKSNLEYYKRLWAQKDKPLIKKKEDDTKQYNRPRNGIGEVNLPLGSNLSVRTKTSKKSSRKNIIEEHSHTENPVRSENRLHWKLGSSKGQKKKSAWNSPIWRDRTLEVKSFLGSVKDKKDRRDFSEDIASLEFTRTEMSENLDSPSREGQWSTVSMELLKNGDWADSPRVENHGKEKV